MDQPLAPSGTANARLTVGVPSRTPRAPRAPGGPLQVSGAPPLERRPEIHAQRLGFELEFGGLSEAEVAQIAADFLAGTARQASRYHWQVETEALGRLRIEVDSRFFSAQARASLSELTTAGVANPALDLARELSRSLVPVELITPPLALKALPTLDALVETLARQGAWGAQRRAVSPFGFQINAEAREVAVEHVLSTVRAVLVLYEQLAAAMDLSRRVSGYVADYTKEFKMLVLDPRYVPSWERWVDDYLRLNPTRNRPLDLLPLLAYREPQKVRAALDDKEWQLVKPRPAYHYRLPDCRVGDAAWSVSGEVDRWHLIESLAMAGDELVQRCATLRSSIAHARWYSDHLLDTLSLWTSHGEPAEG